jgi:Transposase
MAQPRTREQIQRLLREADRDRAKGLSVRDTCRKIGVSQNSYCRWRKRLDSAVLRRSCRRASFSKKVGATRRLLNSFSSASEAGKPNCFCKLTSVSPTWSPISSKAPRGVLNSNEDSPGGTLRLKKLHRPAVIEVIPWNGSSEPEFAVQPTPKRLPRFAQACLLLPVSAGFRPVRDPGGACLITRRQQGQGDTGAETLGFCTACKETIR